MFWKGVVATSETKCLCVKAGECFFKPTLIYIRIHAPSRSDLVDNARSNNTGRSLFLQGSCAVRNAVIAISPRFQICRVLEYYWKQMSYLQEGGRQGKLRQGYILHIYVTFTVQKLSSQPFLQRWSAFYCLLLQPSWYLRGFVFFFFLWAVKPVQSHIYRHNYIVYLHRQLTLMFNRFHLQGIYLSVSPFWEQLICEIVPLQITESFL